MTRYDDASTHAVAHAWPRRGLAAVLCAAALACGSDGEAPAGDAPSGEAPGDGSMAVGELEPFATPACAAPAGVSTPSLIADVVDWINALPKPLSLACFLETLERPLRLYATESLFSAQPAVGRRSPRLFLFSGSLIMSIVPDGDGRHLLEFGEPRTERTSLKGEVVFPVSEQLTPATPFDHLLMNGTTTCSGCHGEEEVDTSITFARAFTSRSLRPVPDERVGLAELYAEARACNAAAEPERCAMLVALFGQGNVVDAEFPARLDTFY
ncbi:MAG TPA: hypothetical protein VMG12_27885 [Polyangiaceae bacterium]|nr:hypothetical protein [Polyangiaceae bacterium]